MFYKAWGYCPQTSRSTWQRYYHLDCYLIMRSAALPGDCRSCVQGRDYWASERRLCACMHAVNACESPETQVTRFTEQEVLVASKQKSFDYRVRLM